MILCHVDFMGNKTAGKNDLMVICENRRARHHVDIADKIEAGLVLTGSEVKSCRVRQVNLQDSFVRVHQGEALLVGGHISTYGPACYFGHATQRERKLLLHRREIDRLEVRIKQQGQIAVPLRMYFKNGKVKVEIGIGKGKTYTDRRETVREREMQRDIDRAMHRH